MFRYCPSCASVNIRFEQGKKFVCPDCGFTYYHNIAAAAACIICTGPAGAGGVIIPGEERIVFLVRGRDPAKGRLDLPGGFVDAGEGVVEGLRRECREELGWEAPRDGFSFLASFPNVYPYKNITYNTCDMFFTALAPGLKAEDFRLEKSEIEGIQLIKPQDVRDEDIAFDSVRRAVRFLRSKDHAFIPRTGQDLG
jgi:8-oxo-dGTP pyrophosphatase MutT (NUDIX family)